MAPLPKNESPTAAPLTPLMLMAPSSASTESMMLPEKLVLVTMPMLALTPGVLSR